MHTFNTLCSSATKTAEKKFDQKTREETTSSPTSRVLLTSHGTEKKTLGRTFGLVNKAESPRCSQGVPFACFESPSSPFEPQVAPAAKRSRTHPICLDVLVPCRKSVCRYEYIAPLALAPSIRPSSNSVS